MLRELSWCRDENRLDVAEPDGPALMQMSRHRDIAAMTCKEGMSYQVFSKVFTSSHTCVEVNARPIRTLRAVHVR